MNGEIEKKQQELKELTDELIKSMQQYFKEYHSISIDDEGFYEIKVKMLDPEKKVWHVRVEVGYTKELPDEVTYDEWGRPEYTFITTREEVYTVPADEEEVQEVLNKHGRFFELMKKRELLRKELEKLMGGSVKGVYRIKP